LKWAGTVTMASFVATGLAQSATTESANAMLKDTNGQEVGTASFTQTPAGVLLKLSIREMSSRAEGFHLRALLKPYVNLSIHTAPDVRPLP
jgi:Cu/Zn superoxide dismutase